MIEYYLPGEADAIKRLLAIADMYGYGNCIAHLKRAWAIWLMENSSMSYEQALLATDVPAYPLEVKP